MTLDEFFIRRDYEGCRHIDLPGSPKYSKPEHHLIFHQSDGMIKVSRIKVGFAADGYITRDEMQEFLDMKFGITELWRKCKRFRCQDFVRLEKTYTQEEVMDRLIS